MRGACRGKLMAAHAAPNCMLRMAGTTRTVAECFGCASASVFTTKRNGTNAIRSAAPSPLRHRPRLIVRHTLSLRRDPARPSVANGSVPYSAACGKSALDRNCRCRLWLYSTLTLHAPFAASRRRPATLGSGYGRRFQFRQRASARLEAKRIIRIDFGTRMLGGSYAMIPKRSSDEAVGNLCQ